ncbi:MAG: AMP-binding protein [Candidatus Contendobacter sp.]
MRETRWGYTGQQPPAQFNMARYCLAAAQTTPDKVALLVVSDAQAPVEQAEAWTYRQLDDAVRRVAAGLRAFGLESGARLMIRMGNTSDYALLFFGAIAAGCVPLPSSAQLTEEEAAFLLSDSGARALALSDDLAITPPPGVRVFGPAAVAALRAADPPQDYAPTAADDPAFLVYTSGTTGQPKGVLHAQRSAWGRRPMYQGWYGIRSADVFLHAGAFNWTYTLGVGLTDPWANGATAVLYNGPRDVTIWPLLMAKFRATVFAAVPGLYRQILKYNDLHAFDLSSLRHGLTAGEALNLALLEQWRATTGKELYEALGMSECSTYISSSPSVPVKPGSPGKPQQGRCVVALPVEGGEEPLMAGETGLLAVHRSDPGLMLGYWNRLEEEALVYRGEWFIGGDLAHFDADGYLVYHGRNDDVMNAMGYRVSPLEVEHCLSQHPAVAEVAVTELTVREGVSVIAAFVVPRDPDEPDGVDAAPLLAYAHQHLAAYKCPREVIFTASLPRTANGKVRRRDLARR